MVIDRRRSLYAAGDARLRPCGSGRWPASGAASSSRAVATSSRMVLAIARIMSHLAGRHRSPVSIRSPPMQPAQKGAAQHEAGIEAAIGGDSEGTQAGRTVLFDGSTFLQRFHHPVRKAVAARPARSQGRDGETSGRFEFLADHLRGDEHGGRRRRGHRHHVQDGDPIALMEELDQVDDRVFSLPVQRRPGALEVDSQLAFFEALADEAVGAREAPLRRGSRLGRRCSPSCRRCSALADGAAWDPAGCRWSPGRSAAARRSDPCRGRCGRPRTPLRCAAG